MLASETEQPPAPKPPTGHFSSQAILWAVLALALVVAAADLPSRWSAFQQIIPVVQQWGNPEAQYRLETRDLPYPHDLLRQADALLPAHASVLLVTPGTDVERVEYITFNRALYLLAPRSVWWATPAPPDGTWKGRWRMTSPLTSEALAAIARDKQAQYILAYDLPPDLNLNIGKKLAQWPDGFLLSLGKAPPYDPPPTYQQFAGALWPLQILLAVTVILTLGWLIVQLASSLPGSFRPGRLETLALAWPLGAGLATVLMLWLSWLGLPLQWQIVTITLLTVALILLTLVFKRRTPSTINQSAAAVYDPMATVDHGLTFYVLRFTFYVLVLFITIQTIFVAVSAVGRPLTVWDSWANWAIKARIIFLDGFVSSSVYADSSRAITQLDYPLMVPLVESWLFGWLGAPDDRLAGVASVLFFSSLLALVYCVVRSQGASNIVALAICAVAGTMWQIAILAGIVFTEAPLIVFAAIAGIYLYKWMRDGSQGALLIASIAAGLMPWTKREGALLLFALCAGLLLTSLNVRRAWVAVTAMVLGAVVLAAPWWLFIAQHGIVNPAFSPITLTTLSQNISRVPTIAGYEFASLLSQGFSYIWPLAFVAGLLLVVATRKHQPLRSTAFLPVAALLYVLLTGFTYVFSSFVPYEQHVVSSIDRLLAEVVLLMLLWLLFLAYPPAAKGQFAVPSTH